MFCMRMELQKMASRIRHDLHTTHKEIDHTVDSVFWFLVFGGVLLQTIAGFRK